MKNSKLILSLLFLFFAVGCVCLGFVFPSNNQALRSVLSDERTTLFSGETSQAKLTLTCGVREEPYEQNGMKAELVPFGILKLRLFPSSTLQTISYVLTVGETSLSGTLEKSPYENAYFHDIERQVLPNESLSFSFTLNESVSQIAIECVSLSWQVGPAQAFQIALNRMEELHQIKKWFLHSKWFGVSIRNVECRLQILSNDAPLLTNHFWHFSLLSASTQLFSCVIDPHTGQILAQSN